MAYQSEIELRVKVVDKELRDLENRLKSVQQKARNPFTATGTFAPGRSPADKAARKAQEKAIELQRVGLNVEKNRLNLVQKLNVERVRNLNLNTSWYKALQQGKQIQLDINKAVQREGDLRKRTEAGARRRKFTDVATGAGFPLLFGGGPLQAVAGGVGGAFGGLGGSIAASAIVAQLEGFVQGLSKLADSLKSTKGVISGLEAAGYRVSDVTKDIISSYEKAGLFTDAYALAIAEVNRVLGPDGVAKLQAYDQETKKLQAEFEKVTAALQSEMLPALTGLIRLILGTKEAFDALSNSPFGKAVIAGSIAAADIAVPGGKVAREAFSGLQRLGAPIGEGPEIPDSVRRAQEARAEERLVAQQKAADAARNKLYIVEAELEVIQAGNDLLDENVVKAKERVIQEEFLAKVRKENLTAEEESLAKKERSLALGRLELQVDGARAREAEKQRRAAERAQKEAERLRKQTEQLRLQSLLATSIREQNQFIAEAQRKGNTAEVLKLQILKERLALGIQEALIENEKLTPIQEEYKLVIAREQAQTRINALNNQDLARQQQIVEAVQSTIASMDKEIALIDATLDGRREEVILNQEINALVKSTGAETLDQVESIERMVKLLNERRKAEESFNIQQQTRFAGAGLGAGFIGGAGRKFEETLIAGGSLGRATELAQLTQEMELAQMVAQNLESSVLAIGDAFGAAMTTGVQGLIEGTKSAEEVFAEFLKTIAQALLKSASQMIATYIAIGIARAFAGMGSKTPDLTQSTNLPSADLFSGGLTPKPFAEGGFVDRPTNAVIGEGSEPEYVIPESKMRESMARYSRGSRGASVIPESGGGDSAASGGGTAVAAPIDVRYTVERINSVDYVTADQFQRGMQSAATQGAKQGEQNTLKRLQMSGSTRRRLGL